MLIQYLTTALACLILALVRSWSLTLVILSAIPLLVIVQGVSQGLAVPLYHHERNCTAQAGTRVDRAAANITTVKAFNATKREESAFANIVDQARDTYTRCAAIWAAAGGITHFTLFAMFVQGYWFGSKLVREGKISSGDVTGVFWACLIASSNLQMCVPLLVVLTKGKTAMVSLVTLIESPTPSAPDSVSSPSQHTLVRKKSTLMRRPSRITRMAKITPAKCHGGFNLHDVTFTYPSRPTIPVLSIKALDIAAGETTFIVGGSGSGKSTVAQLLLGMYEPGEGKILLDDQEMRVLEGGFVREHVALVTQSCILFDMSIHDNVAIGLAGRGEGKGGGKGMGMGRGVGRGVKRPQDVTREEVEAVCRAALMHEFVRDLPDGYDTILGTGGQSLSGGQKQRLAIARAMMRDPTVLILGAFLSSLSFAIWFWIY